MKIGVVMNPRAGGGRMEAMWPSVARMIEAKLGPFELRRTAKPGDGSPLALTLAEEGADLVIAAGGDGTMSEVVDGLMRAEWRAEFGIIPVGTGVDFPRNFELGGTLAAAVEDIASGRRRTIDAGKISYIGDDGRPAMRHFVNVASLGLSGPTVRAVNRAKLRGGAGKFVFLYHTLAQLLGYRAPKVRIRLDGAEEIDAKIAVVAAANGRYFGAGLMVAPGALLDDGLLDVVIVAAANKLKLIQVLSSAYDGGHSASPLCSFRRAKVITIAPLGDKPVVIDIDGESPGRAPVRIEVLPGALTFRG